MGNLLSEKRILIVEDTLEWQKVHITLLGEYSRVQLSVDVASSAREGIEYVQNNIDTPYDLILTDLQMETDFLPDLAGEWFIKETRLFDSYKKVPIVIISAAYNIEFIAANLNVGFLSKRSLIANSNSYNLMMDEQLL